MADMELIRKKYALETDLLHWELWLGQLQGRLPERKYEKRQAEQALREYAQGSLRGFLDRFSGIREEKLEALGRAVRTAEASLQAIQREITDLEAQITRARTELEALGAPDVDLDREPEGSEVRRLEAVLCARTAIPALEGTRKALEFAREWARPDMRIEAVPGEQKFRYLAQAEEMAGKSLALLERIGLCGMGLTIPPYLRNPAGYLAGSAMKFGELDRINGALEGIRDAQGQVRELILRLSEE